MSARIIWLFICLCWLLSSCQTDSQSLASPIPLATLMPTPTVDSRLPSPIPSVPPNEPSDSGWVSSTAAGIEHREQRSLLSDGRMATLVMLRIDPSAVRFQVAYDPVQPQSLRRWATEYNALAAINGGFFDAENRTVSLLIQAGQRSGQSYEGRGGMFGIRADGSVWLRALASAPFDSAEEVSEGLQGWPMLLGPSGVYAFEDGERARRSAVAIDRAGRVLFIISISSSFSLHEFAEWLAASDLDTELAVNLDGGSSSALLLNDTNDPLVFDSFVPLPIALLVVPR